MSVRNSRRDYYLDLPPVFVSYFVMIGLKSFLPALGAALHWSPSALYGRQQALVRLGLLESIPGKGPGSGTPLTPYNLAALILAVLACDTLAEVDQRVVDLCEAKPVAPTFEDINAGWSEKHGNPTLRSELAKALERLPSFGHTQGQYYEGLIVKRNWYGQIISPGFSEPGPAADKGVSTFYVRRDRRGRTPIMVSSEIDFTAFEEIQHSLLSAMYDNSEDHQDAGRDEFEEKNPPSDQDYRTGDDE